MEKKTFENIGNNADQAAANDDDVDDDDDDDVDDEDSVMVESKGFDKSDRRRRKKNHLSLNKRNFKFNLFRAEVSRQRGERNQHSIFTQ